MIPNRIWTYWEGPQPEYIRLSLESIVQRSGVQVTVLNQNSVHEVVGSALNQRYKLLTDIAQRADCMRLAILFNEGGFWCDADTLFLKPAKTLFDFPGHVGMMRWPHNQRILNGYILADQGSLFIKSCLDRVNAALEASSQTFHHSSTGCFFGEDVLNAVPIDGTEHFLSIDTLIPVVFPINPAIWTQSRTIYEHLTERTIAIGLNNSHMSAVSKAQNLQQLCARNDLFGSAVRAYVDGTVKKAVFYHDDDESSFWNLKVPRVSPTAPIMKPTSKPPVRPVSMFARNTGTMAVYVVAVGDYQWYAPLFVHCMRKAYPKIPVVIGHCDLDPWVRDYLSAAGAKLVDLSAHGISDSRCRALRFLVSDGLEEFDYVLIGDIDIMILNEDVPIADQHIHHMTNDGTICYENWIEEYVGGTPRLSGVHFITKAWWQATRRARAEALSELKLRTEFAWHEDEVMLGKVVVDSCLPLPTASAKLWRNHGVHCGDYRRSKGSRPNINAWQSLLLSSLLKDDEFMLALTRGSQALPFLSIMAKTWKSYFV